jgi:hypothetical protein
MLAILQRQRAQAVGNPVPFIARRNGDDGGVTGAGAADSHAAGTAMHGLGFRSIRVAFW